MKQSRLNQPVGRMLVATFILTCGASTCLAVEHVLLRRNGAERTLTGRILVEAQDGGLLFQTRDGEFWMCQPEEIAKRARDETPFAWLDKNELAQQMLGELPDGYRVHQTAHFVICYNTTEVYAKWCGSLLERLHDGFFLYWKRFGFELQEPEYALPAVIHQDKSAFTKLARGELGEGADVVVGYYSMKTNRVSMYDLTGADELRPLRGKIRSTAHINQILSQPGAERTVATIVHETTHQLAYNSGLQTRYAGNPFWISEGMAVFFESPDLSSSKGWRGIGRLHRVQLTQFRKTAGEQNVNTLREMLSDDAAFRTAETAGEAYANAWAWNYFLMRRHRDAYVAYLKELSQLAPLEEWSPEQRVQKFEASLEKDLETLQREFIAYMRRAR